MLSSSPTRYERSLVCWRRVSSVLVSGRGRRCVVSIAMSVLTIAACGGSGSGSGPGTVLDSFLAGWGRGDWVAMRVGVADPPANFATLNAAAFAELGVNRAGSPPLGSSNTAPRRSPPSPRPSRSRTWSRGEPRRSCT